MTNKKNLLIFFIILLSFVGGDSFCQDKKIDRILWSADWSSNGDHIAIGGNLDTLKIYSAPDLKLYKAFPIKNTITCVKWHPTRNILVVSTQSSNENPRIFNFEQNKIISLESISPDGARGVDWNYTGEFLAVADNDGQISIFDMEGNVIRTIKQENTKSITAIDWHPKKNIFITVGDKIRIFDINGTLLNTINHRKEAVLLLSVAWHNSGKFFVTGDYGDMDYKLKPLLQFWNSDGKLIKSINKSRGEYRNIKWNAGGNRVATSSDALRIWNTSGNLMYEGSSKDYLWGLSWNEKGDTIVTSSKKKEIVIWDSKAKKILTEE